MSPENMAGAMSYGQGPTTPGHVAPELHTSPSVVHDVHPLSCPASLSSQPHALKDADLARQRHGAHARGRRRDATKSRLPLRGIPRITVTRHRPSPTAPKKYYKEQVPRFHEARL